MEDLNGPSVTAPFSNNADPLLPQIQSPPDAAAPRTEHEWLSSDNDEVVLWPLANGGFARISRSDIELVARYIWRRVSIGGHVYACTRANGGRLYMHRLICGAYKYWDVTKSKWIANQIDHANGDGLDNRRQNLRSSTHRTNQQNSRGHPSARRSLYKGVAYCTNRKRPWRTVITVNGRQLHGGYFDTEEEAAQRYDQLASEHFGAFARPNNTESQTDGYPHPSACATHAYVIPDPLKEPEVHMNTSNSQLSTLARWFGKISPPLFVILAYLHWKASLSPNGQMAESIHDIANGTGLSWRTVQPKLREIAALDAIEILSSGKERTLIRIPSQHSIPPAESTEPEANSKGVEELIYDLSGQRAFSEMLQLMMAAAGNDELRLKHCLDDFFRQGNRWATVELLTVAVQDELRPRSFFDEQWSRP